MKNVINFFLLFKRSFAKYLAKIKLIFSMPDCSRSLVRDHIFLFLLHSSMHKKRSRNVLPLLIVSLFGLLFVTSCGGKVNMDVTDAEGHRVGEVQVTGEQSVTILDARGGTRGKVEKNIITDDTGTAVGSVEERDGHMLILDEKGNGIGSIEKDTECYGKTQELLGKVSANVSVNAVGGACLLIFLPKA